MGRNFDDYPGFQPKTTFMYYFAHDCRIIIGQSWASNEITTGKIKKFNRGHRQYFSGWNFLRGADGSGIHEEFSKNSIAICFLIRILEEFHQKS